MSFSGALFSFLSSSSPAGAAEGWGGLQSRPLALHCLSAPGAEGSSQPYPIFGDFCVRILILKIKAGKKRPMCFDDGCKEYCLKGGELMD